MNRYLKPTENKMKFKNILILILLSSLIAFGCDSAPEDEGVTSETAGSSEPESTTPAVQTTSIKVRIDFNTKSSSVMFNAQGTVDEVSSITVEAFTVSDNVLISSTQLENILGVWEGTLTELPYDVPLNLIASAYNSSNTNIFSGSIDATLEDGQTTDFTFQMASIDDQQDPNNPKIVSATLPEMVMIDSSDHLLSFQISHSSDVEYAIEVVGGKIAKNMGDTPVSVLSGVHNPGNNLEIYYYAPIDALIATLNLTVKDTNGSDEIGTSFTISVVSADPDTWTDSGISVVFGPTIIGMEATRSETTLKLELATDPDNGLTYSWTGTGSFSGLAETGNPIFIASFSDDQAGDIQVTVTDENDIEAFMTRTIEAGDYPHDINTYVADMPGIYIYDEITDMLWMDNTNKIRKSWSEAQAYCADLTLIDYSIWRLPTANELANMYERRDDFSNYYDKQYWTADDDPDFDTKAIVIDFSDGSQASQSKSRQKIVRCVKD